MTERITTERVRELLAVDGTRRLFGGVLLDAALVRDLAADLLDARRELAAVRSAVRMLDGARAAIDANGQRVLRSLAGEERAALLEELAAARRERDDWNARATAMEAERDETLTRIAAVMGCAPADADDLVEAVRLLVAERDGARAELEATERARQAAEEERDTVLELVADDAVAVARQRDDRDAARLHAVATLRVALADAETDRDKALAAVAAERTRREAAEASATRSADAAVDAVRELGHVAAAAVARADAAEARLAALACADDIERKV